MSCEVKTFASLPDLKHIQQLFGFTSDETWLNAVFYSISPTTELIAFGHGSRFVVMGKNWKDSGDVPTYGITWSGELEDPNEIITSIICLPIYGNNVSFGAEWTCITIGLASGLVLFYIDSGIQIFSQRWHHEPVQTIKAHSSRDDNDELHVGYLSCMCIIKATQLFPVLKGFKQNLTKNVTSRFNGTNVTEFSDTVSCRKWDYHLGFTVTINDSVVVGPQKTSTFDHLMEQSLTNHHAKVRSAPPQKSLVMAVGIKPYLGYYYAKEGFVEADFRDVAKAIASKVVSSLPSWLYKSNNSQVSEPSIAAEETMECRFGLCDFQRHGLSICLAPGNNLVAVTDNLSRVMLIDTVRGVAIRIWKGYRDAQCSFIKVKEKTLKGDKNQKRKALFLVIYAPRRACLEIWALQHGPKIAAFNVSKNGQLVYNNFSLMGIQHGAKPKFSTNPCLFIDPSDETIKEIQIPFHCALKDGNSQTVKDIHLLRRMKVYLRNEIIDADISDVLFEIENLCFTLQTDEIRLQLIKMLSENKKIKPIVFKTAVLALKTAVEKEQVDENSSNMYRADRIHLTQLLENYERLVEFYMKPDAIYDDHSISEDPVKLGLSENDLETIQKLLDLTQEQHRTQSTGKVTFQEKPNENEDFLEFLNAFHADSVELRLDLEKSKTFPSIGDNLFKRFLARSEKPIGFVDAAVASQINSDDLLVLILKSWLEKPFVYTKSENIIEDMTRLAGFLQAICDLADGLIVFEYNSICQWWQNVREIILESPCALRGLLAAIVCRNISMIQQRKHREGSCNSCDEIGQNEDDNWEQVSHEAAQWSLLIGKLDDISVLGAILSFTILSLEQVMPPIAYEKPDCSLKVILCSGKGIVSELVAKWILHSQIEPQKIVETPKLDTTTKEAKEEEIETNIEKVEKDLVCQHLQHLRDHFPFSLQSGMLLCQMAWEYMSHWSKNLSSITYLVAGLSCLDSIRVEDLALKHGICCMIWNAHLKIPLEATKKLIQKTGRLPKEKLCQQDIGMSVSLVCEFLEHCLNFLKHFSTSLEYDERELKFEEILTDKHIPLQFLALQQNHANKEILQLHVELCKVLHLITFFQLKIVKPMTTVFDPMANQTFFIEMNRELQYVLPAPDLVLQKQREEFLCKAITASMDLIREDLERLYVIEHVSYMDKIVELADLWKMDKHGIRRHQVVELYAHGWDSYADELLENLTDDDDIGGLLLEIAGRRLNLLVSNSQNSFMIVASVGPQLLNYLDNIGKQTGVQIHASTPEEIEIDRLTTIAATAFKCLSQKESSKLHIAGQMYDACSLLAVKANKNR